MIYRCILPSWAQEESPNKPPVLEGQFSEEKIAELTKDGYNIYFLPNYPSIYNPNKIVDGSDIDVFRYVYVDFDLKHDKLYGSKEAFVEVILRNKDFLPSAIVDSGNGVHVYWEVKDLIALDFLRFQRRLCRHFTTDEAVSKIYQLMRVPNTFNTKVKGAFKICKSLYTNLDISYTVRQLDRIISPISSKDSDYCQQHYDKTYNPNKNNIDIDDRIPKKFLDLVRSSTEVKNIWSGNLLDRSKGDYRLGHIMFANSFTKEEAISVLVNSGKALQRAPVHRLSYASNIVDQIWTYELEEDKNLDLSNSVKEVLDKYGSGLKGTRFACWSHFDNTANGFRLGQVIGLVAGSGVGKTAVALNMFLGFVKNNPDYDHFFVPLEQPANEIAERWKIMCEGNEDLYEKVQILSNYSDDGQFRHLSFSDIRDYILKYQEVKKRKVGAIVIDHIGALKKKGKEGENQDLMDICHSMKAFAIETNTLLVMQSQAPRQKAGIGDLELDKDAAYGTVYFESYCDYLITLWQPLKRCYIDPGCPTVTAFKFCKIRHKKKDSDVIQEDLPYILYFDSKNELMRQLTESEEKAFSFWNQQAINKRKKDKNTDVIKYKSAKTEGLDGKAQHT